jgi:hypothetical protein
MRVEALSVDEGEMLGATIAVLIAHSREILREKFTVAHIKRSLLPSVSKVQAAAATIIETIIISRQYVLITLACCILIIRCRPRSALTLGDLGTRVSLSFVVAKVSFFDNQHVRPIF